MHKKINENIKINYSNLICSSFLQRPINLTSALHFSHLGCVVLKTGVEIFYVELSRQLDHLSLYIVSSHYCTD